MKHRLSLSLTGKSWWKPFLCFFSGLLVALILHELTWMRFLPSPSFTVQITATIIVIASIFPILFVLVIFFFFIWGRIIPALSCNENPFTYKAEWSDLLALALQGCALSVITVGLYIPRFIKRIAEQLGRKTAYRGSRILFYGSAEKLFKKYLLGVLVPVVIWLIAILIVSSTIGESSAKGVFNPIVFFIDFSFSGILLVCLSPFVAALLHWLCDFRWNGLQITMKGDLAETTQCVAIHTALSVLTLGLYFPAAAIFVWRHVSGNIVISEGMAPKTVCGFDEPAGKGFLFIWGQMLLSLITFGIYMPWASVRIMRFFAQGTYCSSDKIS